MQLNQVSQILQPKVTQSNSNINTNNNDVNNTFESMLQEMIKNTGNSATNNINGITSSNSANATDKTGIQSKTSSGLDSLSVNPQKLAQMLQIMQMNSQNNSVTDFGNDDDSDSDSDSSDLNINGNSDSSGGTDSLSQLLQTVLQNQETSNSNAQNSNSSILQTQQIATNSKS